MHSAYKNMSVQIEDIFLHTCGQDVGFILQPTSCPHQGSVLTQTCIPCGLPAEFWQAWQAAEHKG